MTGFGFISGIQTGGLYLYKVTAHNCSKSGFQFGEATLEGSNTGCVDVTATECYAQGNKEHGFVINDPNASSFTNCRSEWNSLVGFRIIGRCWSLNFLGCNTDRNGTYGFEQRTTQRPVIYTSTYAKRDGASTGGFAGFYLDAQEGSEGVGGAAIFTGCMATVGTDDNGGGTMAPAVGLLVGNVANVSLDGGAFYGGETPIVDPNFNVTMSHTTRVMTGSLFTADTTAPQARITASQGVEKSFKFYTRNGGVRWSVGTDKAFETTANSGTNFAISRHADNGDVLSTSLGINRQTGEVRLGDYGNTRNDVDTTTPTNFLYTSSSGYLRSGSIDLLRFGSPTNVTASRSRNVSYTNTLKRSIFVSVYVTGSSSTAAKLTIDNVEVASNTASASYLFTGIVKPGGKYSFDGASVQTVLEY